MFFFLYVSERIKIPTEVVAPQPIRTHGKQQRTI